MTDYSVDYFIAKFEAIPEEAWCTNTYNYNGQFCAYGHCGARENILTDEALALEGIFRYSGMWPEVVNDGEHKDYQQPTPKQRILAALRDIKAGQK